ncbi:MAG: NAD-dependent epimerase/dehydratase [Ilumatobacteraceae bacterium]|nr:NAD-dependent epimerase/dehydratase [Ilumatobacteraceae bacterium]
MRLLIAGGTGFVGRHLSSELMARGHDVTVMSRHPSSDPTEGAARQVAGDIADPGSLVPALADIDAAYYLVHSLDRPDFVEYDRAGAHAFGTAAQDAGVDRLVYMGGLGRDDDDLSPHLRSRREVEQILGKYVATTSLRAGIVVGEGGTSWEILCQLVERLPIMITPKWVQTTTQPIALSDVVALLAKSLDVHVEGSDHFDVGTPDALSYQQMLKTVADEMHRRLFILPVPVLSPSLSSHWLRLITDVDLQTARSLVDSMTNEVVVTERRLEQLTGHRPMTFRSAARQALLSRRQRAGAPRDGAHVD